MKQLSGFLKIVQAGDYDAFVKQQTAHAKGCVGSGRWTQLEARQHIAIIPQLWARIFDNAPPPQAPAWKCDTCQDQGAVELEGIGMVTCPNPDCAVAQQNVRRRYEYWKRRLEHLGSASYYQRLRFETWDAMELWKRQGKGLPYMAAKLYADAPRQMVSLKDIYEFSGMHAPANTSDVRRNSIVFYGDLGVGKTGLAASIMWVLQDQSIPVLMVRTWDMLAQIKDRYFKQNEDETAQDLLRIVQQVPVLILDEWGLQKRSETDIQRMEEIIRYRHGQGLPMVMTTNLRPDEFGTHWGHRTADVLMEVAHVIEVRGAKIRETAYPITEGETA